MNKLFFRLMAFLFVLWLCPINSQAQLTELEDGAFYRFVNVDVNTKVLAASSTTDVGALDLNENDLAQIWQVTKVGDYYTFINVSNLQYLKGNTESSPWGLTVDVSDTNLFEFVSAGAGNSIRSKAHFNVVYSGYAYMHRNNSDDIVGWETGNTNTQWTLVRLEKESVITANALKNLINYAENWIEDNVSDNVVGCYNSSAVSSLTEACSSAKKLLNRNESICGAFAVLLNEYNQVNVSSYTKINIIPGLKYSFENKNARNYMSVGDNGNVVTNSSDPNNIEKNQWIIETGSTQGTYRVKNVSTGTYLQAVAGNSENESEGTNGSDFSVGETPADYVIVDAGNGYMAFATAKYPNYYMDRYNADRVATWGTNISNNAQWMVRTLDKEVSELKALVFLSENLIGEVALKETVALSLQTTNAAEPNYLYCNAPYTDSNNGDYSPASKGYNLLDGNTGTHLHTRWSGESEDGLDHYLRVDLGEDNNVVEFSFKYATANRGNNDLPQKILIQGCDSENGEYTTIATLTKDDNPNPLPTALNTVSWYNSNSYPNDYRFLRFMVTETGRKGAHYYFTMSEFGVYTPKFIIRPKYSSISEVSVKNLYFAVIKAKALMSSSATIDELNEATAALQTEYNNLYSKVNYVDDTAKNEIQALIDKVNLLISSAGSATIVEEGDVYLSGMLYSNAPYTAGGTGHSDYSSAENGYNLLDGNTDTYFHSDYNSLTMVSDPYIRVDLGEDNKVAKFKFNYTTRNATGCAPKTISVYGGNYDANILDIITTAEYLNSVTTATRIAIKNISNTNSYYFAGIGNIADYSQEVVFVWEPAINGTAGSYYLRLEKNGENGYIQQGTSSLQLGTKDNAQEFYVVEPVSGGTGVGAYNDTGDFLTHKNLVRFVSKDGKSWLNCQADNGTPKYVSGTALGAWTAHSVYLVGGAEYNSTAVATFTSGDETNPLETEAATKWESGEITADQPYRFYKFVVTDSEGKKGDKFYFAISEFGYTKVGIYDVVVKNEFAASVTEELLADTRRAVNNAEALLAANVYDGVSEELQAAYSALYAAVSAAVEKSLPVKLTTDTSNPILYNILINRGDGKALQYDGISTDMVAVANRSNSNQTFGWYFMLGNDNKVNIYPYLGRGKALATNDYTEGKSKVKAVATGTDGYGYDWSITKITDSDWYNITILNGSGTTYYFSNNGGVNNKMGFFNSNTSTDGGSMFKFEKVDYEALLSNEGTEVEVLKTTGTGLADDAWKSLWTSNTTLGGSAALKLTVGANNITTAAGDDYLRIYVGQSGSSTYTLTPAAGYYISSYGFKFVKDGKYDGTVSLVVDGVTYNPTDEKQTITSENTAVYPSGAVSFSMSGANKGIIVSDFTVTLKPMVTTYVTYNYYCNSEYVGSETLLAGVGCKNPAPNVVPKGYKASTPDGVVTALATVDIDCDIWSINIGGRLTDVWNTGSWTPLAADDIPDKIKTDVKINDTTVTEVSYKAGLIDIESPGYLSVDFARFIDGNKRLQMVGVDLLDNDGNVVASDYHFGYRGTNHENRIYSLNVAEAGIYNLRYLVSFQGEENVSKGEIDINLYALQNLTAESHITDNWTTTSWKDLSSIPEYITANVKYDDNSNVTVAKVLEGYVDVHSGLLTVNYNYQSGSQRLDILGVDLVDAYGNVVASDYHFGFAGTPSKDNVYRMIVENGGIYKLRYIVSFEKRSNTSSGYNTVVLLNNIEEDKFYRIKSVSTNNYCKDKYVHTNRTSVVRQASGYADNYYNHLHLLFDASVEPASLAMFSFEATGTVGVYKMKNLHTGMYVKSFQSGAEHLGSESDASDVKVTGFAAGQLTLQIGESSPMHAQENYGVIVGWGAEAGGASLWAIEEIDYSAADFNVSIGAVRWSTLCLSYAVQVPEGVTAYAALGVEGTSVVLQSVGDVIPAGTPVLLNLNEDADAGTYRFKYVAESVEPQSQIDNKLVGTYFDSYIEADKENVKYYILAKIDDTTAGMKQIYREYDGNGNLVSSEENPDNGTHFKNNANKVYLPVPIENGANEVKAYSLRIIDGTTGIDEVVGNIGLAPEGIYDLSGRRILEITEPGVYIVNGKKYIKK